jgi:hypothetical protein
MQIRPFAALPLAFALALAGCRGREAAQAPRTPRATILKEIPPTAHSVLRDTSGTPDAEQWTYFAAMPADTAASFYRAMLPVLGWRLLSDRSDRPAGKIDLYARRGAVNLWVHIEKQAEGTTNYTLIAAADTAAGRAAPARADSTP